MNNSKIKILQHNLNRDRTASHQLRVACKNLKVDFLLVQEPLVNNGKIYAFERCKCHISKKSGAAVIVLTDRFQCITLSTHTSNHAASVKVTYGKRPCDYVILASAYFKYSEPTTIHLERLNQILLADNRVIIAADTNGHSPRWHSVSRNRRGRLTEQFIDNHDLKIHNAAGQINTFCRRDNRSSNIDVTLSTSNISNCIGNWSVSDLTDSDHRVIAFTMKVNGMVKPTSLDKRYDTRTADWDLFHTTLLSEIGSIAVCSIESTALGINRVLATAADRAIQRKKPGGTSGKNIWWSPILSTLRQTLARKRREGLRTIDRQAYNRLRNDFLSEIKKHKLAAWKCFAGEMNANPWCKAFKWAKGSYCMHNIPINMTKPDGSLTSDCSETAELLLNTFVPADPDQARCDMDLHGPSQISDLPSPVDIKAAIWRMRPTGAPGADGITAGILRKAWPALRESITYLFGRCLHDGIFPDCWKIAKLIIIPKPGRSDSCNVKSFRPISLLPALGKALETLIIKRIGLETNLDSFAAQHGFTAGKSTVSALRSLHERIDASKSRHIFGTFLDITGAFDNVKWSPLLLQMQRLGASLETSKIVISYLRNRWADLELEGIHYRRMLARGCPQGSQLGPTLWKIAMTPIYGMLPDTSTTKIITYADDILLMVGAARPTTAFQFLKNTWTF
ncbi:unnamed protein product [Macrosiphum euphorbiae]|uniref:Reverse transcriptase domain-containing protein n=1 Tax=Macrosiphum euphorbiae TaxID=13131 RepID=A0AAV0Y6A6_9HEMI|nr:unnamed protein product [Macrosiphum euphorbiae]